MQADLAVVGEAGTGTQAIELYRRHRPDIVLMDLRLPGLDGIETTQALRREFPTAQVIVISAYEAAGEVDRALQAGARGFCLKDALNDELIRAIQGVAAGATYTAAELSPRPARLSTASLPYPNG